MEYQEIHPPRQGPSFADRWLPRLLTTAKALLVFLLFVGILVVFSRPMDEQRQMRLKLDALNAESEALKGDRNALLRRLSWIENDVSYIEVEARDRFNLHKSGEFVLRFEDTPAE